MSDITVRIPDFKFENAKPHWAPHLEFVHNRNATSIIPAYVEPYLIKVLEKTLPLVKDEQLREEMQLFMDQERQHCMVHVKYNRMLRQHYPGLRKFEDRFKNDLDEFLKNKPLQFHLAYAEGFESAFGILAAKMWLDDTDKYRVGADAEVLALWDWHMAEEYEHREVCYKVYMHVCAQGFFKRIVNGYFYRLYGAQFAMKHLGGYIGRIMYHMLSEDWTKMSAEEVAASKARLAEFAKETKRTFFWRMIPMLSPFYNPRTKPEPRRFREALGLVVGDGPYARGIKDPASA